eukprot:gene9464-10451_t
MAVTRRLLHHDMHQRMSDADPKNRLKHPTKNAKYGRQRTALGDLANNLPKRELKSKAKGCQAEVKVYKENDNVEALLGATKKPKAMSICEIEDAKKPKAMSICETEDAKKPKAMSICETAPKKYEIENDQLSIEDPAEIIPDIDKENLHDPYQCPEYAPDIYRYLKTLEKKFRVGDYMHKQTEINERMRSILIDWLIQVHTRFGLLQETLYLTVHVIDRFLERHVVSRSKLQLVGVSAMLLASKYEETYAPEIGDFVYISDNSYTKGQIRKMEQLVLKTLNFDLSNPFCLNFLRRYSKAAQANARQHTLAKYFMELTLVDYKMARLFPSQIAAASLMLSGQILKNSKWTKTLEHYSSFSEEELKPAVQSLVDLVIRAESSKLQAVRSKYAASKQMKVSTFIEIEEDSIKCLSDEVLRIYKLFKKTGSIEKPKRIGRPRKFDARGERNVQTFRLKKLGTKLQDIYHHENPSRWTVKRILQKHAIKSRVRKGKPFISVRNRATRVRWAKALRREDGPIRVENFLDQCMNIEQDETINNLKKILDASSPAQMINASRDLVRQIKDVDVYWQAKLSQTKYSAVKSEK